MAPTKSKCGAANEVLGLSCDRKPHPPGTAHYQDDGNGVRAWRGTSNRRADRPPRRTQETP